MVLAIKIIVLGWAFGEITAPEPAPLPCYKQVDNRFIPYVCGDDE